MNITSVSPISAEKLANNKWRLTVRYTATFTAEEVNPPLNYTFRDSIRVEEDDPFSDDLITGWVNGQNFNPSAASVQRTKVTVVDGNDLDTEWGGEEVRMRIQLRNVTTGGVPLQRVSGIINLAP